MSDNVDQQNPNTRAETPKITPDKNTNRKRTYRKNNYIKEINNSNHTPGL